MKRYEYYRPIEFIWDEKEKGYRGINLGKWNTKRNNIKEKEITLDQAKQLIEQCKKSRQTQYEYHTNIATGEQTRTTFYDTHKLKYTILKVVEEIEEVYEEENEIKETIDYNNEDIRHSISV